MSTFCFVISCSKDQDTIVGTSTNCSAICSAKRTRRLRGGRGVGEILGTSIACSGMRTSKSRHTSTSWFPICGTGTSSDGAKSTVSTICSTVCRWSLSCGLTSYIRSGRVPPSSSSKSEKNSVSPATLVVWLRGALFVASALAVFWLRRALYVTGPTSRL